MTRRLGRKFPLAVKAGNHHAGLGKMRVCDQDSWGDVANLLFAVEEYVGPDPPPGQAVGPRAMPTRRRFEADWRRIKAHFQDDPEGVGAPVKYRKRYIDGLINELAAAERQP